MLANCSLYCACTSRVEVKDCSCTHTMTELITMRAYAASWWRESCTKKKQKIFFRWKWLGLLMEPQRAIDSRFSRAKNLSKPFNTFPDYPVIMLCALHPYLRMRDLSSSRSLILVVCCNITPLGHDGDWIEKRAFLLRISRNIARLKPNNGCK